MEKLKLHTPDFTEANIAKLADLFPNCVTENSDAQGQVKRAIDFDLLKQELSSAIVEGPQERYQLNWPGKREALLTANAPIAKTLRPCREESVDFDVTQNLYIEGDNLDALKLLQETYLGKVKMIYIDPPYNTGNDFIYEDDFAEDSESYLQRSNQKDEAGNRLVANNESNGRFHSDWLSMMYPRLKLARNLLRDDGVIFISIDDGEVGNVRKAADEIFGESNFVANIIWQKKFARANDATYFSTMHDHILCFAKNSKLNGDRTFWELKLLPRTDDIPDGYSNPDNDPRGYWTSVVLSAKSGTEKLIYEIKTPTGRSCFPPDGRYWSVNKEKLETLVEDNRIWFGKNGDGTPRLKTFLSEVQNGLRPNTIWLHQDVGHNQEGRQEVKRLFDDKGYFDSPKPVRLLKTILSIVSDESEFIALDFFAGSSTTAHAVMQLNAEDGGNRKFIMVQLPEICDEKSEAFKAGYKTIAEIGKERIRRAGQKIIAAKAAPTKVASTVVEPATGANLDVGAALAATEFNDEMDSTNIADKIAAKAAPTALDIGFRVLKIDSSNMNEIYYTPDALKQGDLFNFVDNVRDDRTEEDLLFQVLLDWGVDLSLPIIRETIAGNSVFFVDGNALAACFDKEGGITEDFVKQLAARNPLRVVFRDAGFANDSVKINIEQIFKLLSPDTEIKTL